MSASIVQIVRQIIAAKNANAAHASASAGLYGFVLNDSRRTLWETVEAVLEADDETVLDILETVGHWARADYLADSNPIIHGEEIPTHQGEIGKVLIQRANGEPFRASRGKRTAAEIERYRANTGTYPTNIYGASAHTDTGSPLSGFYDISEEDLLFYTGYSAKVEVANVSRSLKTLTDGAINVSVNAKSLTSTSIDSSDAGALAVVMGAGASGVDFASEVRAASVGVATLADAASTTVSNATLWIAKCQSPAVYQSLVRIRAQKKLHKEGDDPTLLAIWEKQAEVLEQRVRQNARRLPDVVAMEKAA